MWCASGFSSIFRRFFVRIDFSSWTLSPPGSLDRYKGCMVAALVGDCVGFLFELPHQQYVSLPKIYAALERKRKDGRIIDYSDDTAMCHALAISLTRSKGLSPKDLANEFRDRYFSDDKSGLRAYGCHVPNCFYAWKDVKGDVYDTSKSQFNGQGSFGNGGAMRTAPVPLFFYSSVPAMLQAAKEAAQLTHYHPEGYEGAMLLSYAIHLALKAKSLSDMEPVTFVDQLIQCCKDNFTNGQSKVPDVHQTMLIRAKELLQQDNPAPEVVIQKLGHSIRALESVTTAIYCALVGSKPVNGIESKNPLERTIVYAVSLGGDCDTIATMAGAIVGAFYGLPAIPAEWIGICDGRAEAEKLAGELHESRL